MEYFVCENVFVPLRSGPTHRSEMLSQVLFGEKYKIIDQSAGWLKIETLFDNYQGWIDMDHLQHSEVKDDLPGVILQKSMHCLKEDKSKIVLDPGSEIYNHDFTKKTFTTGVHNYSAHGDFNESYIKGNEALTDTALRFINSPYIWGGRVTCGIDCSGLTQLVYKMHGIKIPRNSWQQAAIGETVSFINDAKPGDLAFFDNEKGNITHVGMIFSEGLIIHASGRVRIDTIDHQGIYKLEIRGYSHHLRTIKKIGNR
jgi:gamma-D-glutamyl-L-lysine dipeptidyl-peptidase